MTKEEKDLLIRDLCARIPHGVKVKAERIHKDSLSFVGVDDNSYICKTPFGSVIFIPFNFDIKPYLRPMSSMTEEEKKEFIDAVTWEANGKFYIDESEDISFYQEKYDWLNKKMFDYRGLIPRGFALSTEEFNPYV